MKKNKLTALSTLVFFLLQVSLCFADPVLFALPGPMAHMAKIASTDNWDVTLKISVTDAGSGVAGGAQMQFSNDNTNWSAAEAYAVSKAWKLTSGSGAKTVYAKFKDAVGNWSGSVSDAINVAVVPKERIYIYLNGQRVAMEETSGGVSKKYFYHNDHLGSTSVVSDISGAQVKYLEYKPYGETKVEEGSLAVKKKFTGKELDDSTGLYDYGARMYDAKLTRFITADTINPDLANPQTLNRYTYCLNNPLKYVDPTGHYIESPSDMISAAMSFDEFQSSPGIIAGLALGWDVFALAMPGVPGFGGYLLKSSKLGAKVDDVIRTTTKVGRMGNNKAKAFEYYLEQANKLDVATPKNKAVFYSGPGNYKKARDFADKTGKMLIEDTPGGKWLADQNLFGSNSPLSKKQAEEVWAQLSERYATKASGGINAFIRGASNEGIFATKEYRALKKNIKIDKQTYRGY